MGILKKINTTPLRKISLKEEGNALSFFSKTQTIGKQLEFGQEKINDIIKEMKSSDYKNVLNVFMLHFSEFYSLEMSETEKVQYFGNDPLYIFDEDEDEEEDFFEEDEDFFNEDSDYY